MRRQALPPRSWIAFLAVSRVLVFTFLAALLFFALGLLFGIVGIALFNSAAGAHVDMANAYRRVALPLGAAGMLTTLIAMIVNELRESRRTPFAR